MKRKLSAAIGLAGVFLFAAGILWVGQGFSQSADLIEQIGTSGNVNWSTGIIEATGIGAPPERYYGKPQARPMALRTAQVDAYRNLLELVKGVRVDATTEVRDFTTSSDVIRTQVEGMVRGAQVIKRDYMSDGTVEVTIRMNMNGDFANAILPIPKVVKSEQFDRPGAPLAPQAPAAPAPEPPAAGGTVFTGMVVDARGLQARPAMSPKIVDEAGQEVYGSMLVSREYAVQQGMTGYARDLGAAQSNPRVTNNPVTVKGIKTEGPGRANIVISSGDAGKIRSAADNLSFLKKARVMIVLD
ncbi:MAG: hypothetical protein PHC52_14940 [Syntrophales bacterium]|nr:hypothetical protein [Syntrophales bacterium]